MIKARLVFRGKNAREVARSLEPDNLKNMHLTVEDDRLSLEFSAEKIGTMLSTADDILMNIKVAKDTLVFAEER